MDILDKAYDYIDYTLEELTKLEDSCVSLLYFFKLFSPAGKLAQHLLVEHSFIELKDQHTGVACITSRGRDVVHMGGIRNYLDHMDQETVLSKKEKVKKLRKWVSTSVVLVVCVMGYALWKRPS